MEICSRLDSRTVDADCVFIDSLSSNQTCALYLRDVKSIDRSELIQSKLASRTDARVLQGHPKFEPRVVLVPIKDCR